MDTHKIESPAFGSVLRHFRMAQGLSQEELAARLGYNSSGYVSRLELGEKKPSVALLFAIAHALGVKAHEIILAMEENEQHPGEES